MATLSIPQSGTIPGVTVNSTPTNSLTGSNYNSGNLNNNQGGSVVNGSLIPKAYADSNNALNLSAALNSGGITVNQQGGSTQSPPPSNGGGNQAAWQAAGHAGTAPVGYGGESGAAQGPSQDQINQAINDTFNSTNSYLDQAESQVNADYPTVQSDINNQFTSDTGQLKTTNDANSAQFAQQQDKTDYNNQNALAQSRALYNQLRTGYQQRFGGSTSAGDASNEIANVEQQRQMGQTNRSYNDASTSINNNKVQSDAQYQDNLLKLTTQKDASLNQANRDFQNKLLQISQARASNEQAKGAARLQALQDLRNSVNQINLQNTQFQDQLKLYSMFGANTNTAYGTSSTGLLGNSGAATNQFGQYASTAPTSNLQANGGQQQQTQQLTGQIGQANYAKFPNDGFTY